MNRGDAAERSQCVIEKHKIRLAAVREQVATVNKQVEKLLRIHQRTSWAIFESAQAQLLVYLRRAERQVEALCRARMDELVEHERDLETTWDDLALAMQRLIARISEMSELNDEQA